MINLIWKKTIRLLLYPACLERAVFTIHDKNDDEGSQMLGYAEQTNLIFAW